MKKSRLLIAGLSMTMLLSACTASPGKSGSDDKTKFTINGETITAKQYQTQYDLIANVMAFNNRLPSTMQDFFTRYAVAKKELADNKIEIKDADYKAEIDKALQAIGGQANYEDYLMNMNTTKEAFEENIKINYILNRHKEWYKSSNEPTKEEIEKYYVENRATLEAIDVSHILVADEAKAKEVYEKLKKGEDFKKLSDEYSTDTAAKANGGNLGPINKSMGYDETFMDAAYKVKEGEFSAPVKTTFGWHLIKVNKVIDNAEKAKDQIVSALNETKYEAYISEKIKAATVESYDANGKKIENTAPADPSAAPSDDQKEDQKN